MDFIFLLFKLIFALAIVLGLMYISFKLSNNKISQFNEGKYIKVLERNQISKDTAIVVVKIGKKGYVLSTSNNFTNKIDELSEEETFLLEEEKRLEKEKVSKQYEIAITNLKSKISRFKNKKN